MCGVLHSSCLPLHLFQECKKNEEKSNRDKLNQANFRQYVSLFGTYTIQTQL